MDTTKVMEIIGQLYMRLYSSEEQLKAAQIRIRQLEEELGLAKEHGNDTKRASDK